MFCLQAFFRPGEQWLSQGASSNAVILLATLCFEAVKASLWLCFEAFPRYLLLLHLRHPGSSPCPVISLALVRSFCLPSLQAVWPFGTLGKTEFFYLCQHKIKMPSAFLQKQFFFLTKEYHRKSSHLGPSKQFHSFSK